MKKADEADKDIDVDKPIPVIWALGRIMANGQPGFHRLYPRKHVTKIQFMKTKQKSQSTDGDSSDEGGDGNPMGDTSCQPFLVPEENERLKPWGAAKIVDGKLRTFSARLGPSAGYRGYEGMTGVASPGYSWYIQGYLAPELYMQRGITYSFRVEGGNNPHNVETYHPFIISTEVSSSSADTCGKGSVVTYKTLDLPLQPIGGQNALLSPRSNTILAGVETTRRGQSRPTVAGRLCLWTHDEKGRNNFKTSDRRLDESYPTFEKFRNSLKLRCENSSEPSIVEVTPNTSWPDVVYYHSYTQPGMGWRIHVLDGAVTAGISGGAGGTGRAAAPALMTLMVILAIVISSLFCKS